RRRPWASPPGKRRRPWSRSCHEHLPGQPDRGARCPGSGADGLGVGPDVLLARRRVVGTRHGHGQPDQDSERPHHHGAESGQRAARAAHGPRQEVRRMVLSVPPWVANGWQYPLQTETVTLLPKVADGAAPGTAVSVASAKRRMEAQLTEGA